MSLACKGVFIIGAKRTPFCRFGGALRETTAGHAFAAAANEAIRAADLDPDLIDSTTVGHVHYLSQCDGGKTARYCGLYSGVHIKRPALGVNKTCGSGLQAVITGAVDIVTGMSKVSLTGGTEIMSALPHLVRNARFGTTLGGQYQMEDYIQSQFFDSFTELTLERMVEDLAEKHNVTRKEADDYTAQSYQKWEIAEESAVFNNERVELTVKVNKEEQVVCKDDFNLIDNSVETLSRLPSVIKGASIVTTGNSSSTADGAAALLLADEETIDRNQIKPLARISAWACVGVNPLDSSLGAVRSIEKILQTTALNIKDVDLFEINETFAAQTLVCVKLLSISNEKVNVNGGALAVGNPVGATGARMIVHLLYELRRRNAKRGIAASSCGGGQGVAILVESL
ncbi:hypothetical protein ACJJTC_010718 [Scirpophaga incertulas]